MAFPRRYLHEGEEIILDRKPHPVALAKQGAALVLALAIWIVSAQRINPGNGNVNGWISWAGLGLFVVALGWFAQAFITWRAHNFVVTSDRLIVRTGVVSKQGKEIPLERVNDISFHQSLLERMVGAGDLLIESGGEQGQQRFTNVRRPADLQNEIYRQIERTQARDYDRMAGRRELSVPEQIEKLDELRQRGTITQAEFDAKKAQLLDKM